ncbi:MAG TPA: phosphohistidine phosphatase [Verrucomicrobiales bacterium]|nr:phosphohistidine phosphatase [Verrucomicrobiales bacterium]
MELYLLRHAIAVERGTPGIDLDADRPLVEEGRRKMNAVARGMKRLGLKFDAILSSPYRRALETARIAADNCPALSDIVEVVELSADRDPNEFIEVLRSGRFPGESLLVVGHEPFLSTLAARLLASPELDLRMKKAGLCHLSIHAVRPAVQATLNSLLAPRQLRLLGGEKD